MKIYSIICCIVYSLCLYAQDEKYFALGMGSTLGYTTTGFEKASPLVAGIGVTTEFKIAKNYFLETGINYITYANHANDRLWLDCYPCYSAKYMESQYNSIDVPINLLIFLNDKKKYYISTGISSHLFIREKVRFLDPVPFPNQRGVPDLDTWSNWSFLKSDMRITSPELFLNIGGGRFLLYKANTMFNTGLFFRYNVTPIMEYGDFEFDDQLSILLRIALLYNYNAKEKHE